MELSVKEFLDSVTNPNTKKEYRHGIKKFCEWYGKSAEEILELRKDDLTQRAGENLIEYRNRAARFEKEIEKFHSYLLDQHYTINTARNLTLGIRQLFRFYEMGIRFRAGSKVAKTVKTTKNFPLIIDHVRAMFNVADLRERMILSMAMDLGLRIGDFIELKKTDLPPLDQEPPIQFEVMTDKEAAIAHGFLSQETVDLLKVYLPTLDRKNGNPYLFPSNGESHISDEWMNRLLQNLAAKARINLNGKDLTFHCFRNMFLSAAIDSGIGITAGKKLCGKAVAQSDDTYLTTVNLRQKFLQVKKFLTIREQPKAETENIEALRSAINKLQEDLTQQKLITETISQENIKTKEQLEKLLPLVEFVNSYGSYENLKKILNFFKNYDEYPDGTRPKVEFSPYIRQQIAQIAKTLGITEKEAMKKLFDDDVKVMKRGDKFWAELEQNLKMREKKTKKASRKRDTAIKEKTEIYDARCSRT
jgi:site-specific recombinase XerD